MAWSAITSNKMRSFLTMLGIIIGVMSLVVLVSIVNGATTSVTDSISDMGTNLLRVSITDDKENPLRLSELQDFTDNDDIAAAAPTAQSSMTGKSGYTSETTTVYGTTGDYLDIMGLKLGYGRFLKSPDVDNHSYVVILSYDAAIELIGRADAVGETVALDGRSFEVVGVLAEDTSGMNSMSSSSPVLEAYIPYTTLTRMADNVLYVTSFCASAVSEETLDAAEATLTELMMNRFGQDEDAFTIQNQSTLMETMSSVTDTMSMMLGGIAAISLLVGGIGIMNIMLVSVTERTREIGIRKAIGARSWNIMLQFLIEALVVSLMGCMIGIGLSWVILKIAGMVMDSMSFQLQSGVVWLAVGFSAVIGVLFGIYPAKKAAGKHPIEALRHTG